MSFYTELQLPHAAFSQGAQESRPYATGDAPGEGSADNTMMDTEPANATEDADVVEEEEGPDQDEVLSVGLEGSFNHYYSTVESFPENPPTDIINLLAQQQANMLRGAHNFPSNYVAPEDTCVGCHSELKQREYKAWLIVHNTGVRPVRCIRKVCPKKECGMMYSYRDWREHGVFNIRDKVLLTILNFMRWMCPNWPCTMDRADLRLPRPFLATLHMASPAGSCIAPVKSSDI